MASFTHFLRNHLAKWVFLLCVLPWAAWADGDIHARHASYQFVSSHIELSARFDIALDTPQIQALNDGFVLPFTFEFDLISPRSYSWWHAVKSFGSPLSALHYSLSYHALSKHYRLHLGGLYRSFASLDEALEALGAVSGWSILDGSGVATAHTPIQGRVRLKLDTSQLPAPARVQVMGKDAWRLQSGWIDVKPMASGL
ncbi:DUF4390 domain-containing protein [Chitinibacteraceae bacterium HSL-7]